jgi:ferrous-iron efflux pump FieF
MDPDMPLIEAHVASDEVEAMIRAAFADADVIIHQDPYGIEEARATFQR